ncbi:unnamed protein product, partial [Prorocentrum cordatum]
MAAMHPVGSPVAGWLVQLLDLSAADYAAAAVTEGLEVGWRLGAAEGAAPAAAAKMAPGEWTATADDGEEETSNAETIVGGDDLEGYEDEKNDNRADGAPSGDKLEDSDGDGGGEFEPRSADRDPSDGELVGGDGVGGSELGQDDGDALKKGTKGPSRGARTPPAKVQEETSASAVGAATEAAGGGRVPELAGGGGVSAAAAGGGGCWRASSEMLPREADDNLQGDFGDCLVHGGGDDDGADGVPSGDVLGGGDGDEVDEFGQRGADEDPSDGALEDIDGFGGSEFGHEGTVEGGSDEDDQDSCEGERMADEQQAAVLAAQLEAWTAAEALGGGGGERVDICAQVAMDGQVNSGSEDDSSVAEEARGRFATALVDKPASRGKDLEEKLEAEAEAATAAADAGAAAEAAEASGAAAAGAAGEAAE